MDRDVVAALGDLGLSPAEAELYVALLRHAAQEPASAYKLAKLVGRDPANTTKTLAMLERRGAVRVASEKPRLFAPIAAADFTEALVLRLQNRRRDAVRLLETVGRAGADQAMHPLRDRDEALERARLLIGEARSVVLLDAERSFVAALAADLQGAAARAGVGVLALSDAPADLPGVRSWVDPAAAGVRRVAPGPWLNLVVDGAAELQAAGRPAGDGRLLWGTWHRIPVASFLAHRALAVLLVQAALHGRLAAGVDGAAAARQIVELQALITDRVDWRARWQESGLPPAGDVPEAPAPVAAPGPLPWAPPAAPASGPAPGPGPAAFVATASRPEPPTPATAPAPRRARRAKPEPAPKPPVTAEDDGPLQFLHRRKPSR